jgi:hypothetical protein
LWSRCSMYKLWRREKFHSSVGNQKYDSWVPVRSLPVRIIPEVVFGKLCPILQGKEQLPIITLSLLVPIFLQKSKVFQLVQNSQSLTDHKCQVLYSQAHYWPLFWANRITFLHQNPISRRSNLMLWGLKFSQFCLRSQAFWDKTLRLSLKITRGSYFSVTFWLRFRPPPPPLASSLGFYA